MGELGCSRARALSNRLRVVRTAMAEQWRLADQLGSYQPTLTDAVAAARLVGLATGVRMKELDQLAAQVNWAKHAPPPSAPARQPPLPKGTVTATALEGFREYLFVQRPADNEGLEEERPGAGEQ